MRVRTIIELAAFADWYTQQYEHDDFDELCGVSYDETIYDCAVNGGYVSVWAVCGLASVIYRPINSIYPYQINGENDVLSRLLNRTLQPRPSFDSAVDPVTILWTRASHHDPNRVGISSHFVPLVKVCKVPQPTAAVSPYIPVAAPSPTDALHSSNAEAMDAEKLS